MVKSPSREYVIFQAIQVVVLLDPLRFFDSLTSQQPASRGVFLAGRLRDDDQNRRGSVESSFSPKDLPGVTKYSCQV